MLLVVHEDELKKSNGQETGIKPVTSWEPNCSFKFSKHQLMMDKC
jgi:hypothetical protein